MCAAAGPAVAQGRQAGGVTGTVVDSATGAPVLAAEVRVAELHRADRTHQDGRFSILDITPGRYTLSVRRIGFKQADRVVTIVAGRTETLRIQLVPAPFELSPTVVTGALSERPGEEVLSPTSVLSGASLDRKLDATLAASLVSQPGVSMTGIGPTTARPVVRGLGGDRIVILEDGQRPGDLSSMSGDHAVTIDPLTAKQIEVVRGPMSLLYGSSALGGVINVVREEIPTSRPDRLHGTFTLQGLSVNTGLSAGASLEAGVGPFAVRGEGSARTSGDTRTPVGKLENTGADERSVSTGASVGGEWGHAGSSYRFYSNNYGIPGGFVGGHEEGVDIRMRRHTVRGEADLHVDRGPFEEVKGTVTFTNYAHTEYEPSGNVGTVFGQDFLVGETTARHGRTGPFALGALGVRGQYRDITTGGSLRTPSTYDLSFAAFLVEELGTGPIRLQAGLRYDWARYVPREDAVIDVGGVQVPVRERTFGALSGSVGLLHEVSSGIRYGISLNRAYRTPDFNELYSNGPHLAANSFNVGDPELDPETGLGLDVFVRINRGGFSAEIAAFRNQLSDFIFESSRGRAEIGSQGGRPRFQYTNEAARFQGMEGRVEWAATPNLVLDASASYVAARFTSERDSIPIITVTDTTFVAASAHPPFIPPVNGQAGVRLDYTRWFLSANARYAGRQERLGDFEDPTAGYVVPGLTAGFRVVRGSQLHTITVKVDNALDREFRDHLSRIKAIMPEPGRNVSLLYRITM